MDPHLESIFQIVKFGLNTNSYKFALLRGLAELAGATDPVRPAISMTALAKAFIKMYWPLEVVYHIRQGTDPEKDPIVMKAIRKLVIAGHVHHGQALSDFEKSDPSNYLALLAFTKRHAFNDVIDRFHTVRRQVVSHPLFVCGGTPREEIQLTLEAREFLITHQRLVDYIAVAGWVDFNEGASAAPKLFLKLSGERPARGNVSRWRPMLGELQGGRCYYCAGSDLTNAHVDHVLPWSYVLEDRSWNLVLACQRCNGAKSDRLPGKEKIEGLVERNRRLANGELAAEPGFLRDFVEWQARDLGAHVRALHDQALVEQFPVWVMRAAVSVVERSG